MLESIANNSKDVKIRTIASGSLMPAQQLGNKHESYPENGGTC